MFKIFLNFLENCSHYWNIGTKTHPVYEFLNPRIQSWMQYFIRFKTFCEYLYNGGHVFVCLILSLISRGLVGWPGNCCPALISGSLLSDTASCLLSDKLPIVEVAQYFQPCVKSSQILMRVLFINIMGLYMGYLWVVHGFYKYLRTPMTIPPN